MKNIYLFDVDGTLTPAKNKIDREFAKTFLEWQRDKEVYIVSGGSFPRIVDQLGRLIIGDVRGVFSCMGNVFYRKIPDVDGYCSWVCEYENKFTVAKEALFYSELERCVMNSGYHTKTGAHYEERPGMVNFSVVGRNATPEQRAEYVAYDAEHNERSEIVEKLRKKYNNIDFVIGGAVSIDIFNKGNDKSQIIANHFKNKLDSHRIIFVGDRIEYPGNDYSLAELLRAHPNGYAFEVESWRDTRELLKSELFASG